MAEKTTNKTLADRFFKALDHNRYTAVAVAIGATVVSFAGCQVKSTSPFTNEPATRDEIELQRVDFEREQLLVKAKREGDARRRVDAITSAATQEIAKITADLQYDDQVDESAKARVDAQADLAIADIDRRETLIVEGLEFVNSLPFVSANPALGTAINLASMLIVGGVVTDNRRKDKVIKQAKGTTQSGTDAA